MIHHVIPIFEGYIIWETISWLKIEFTFPVLSAINKFVIVDC